MRLKSPFRRTVVVNVAPKTNSGSPPPQQKTFLDLLGVVVSPTVALISALVAAWAGIETQHLQGTISANEQQRQIDVAKLQGDYNEKLQQLKSDSDTAIAKLQEETKLGIAKNQEAINKTTVFSNMIEALSDPQKAGFALLALWQLNPDPGDRKLISAAALATPSNAGINALKSLALIDDSVRASVEDLLSRASASGNTSLASNAQQVVGDLSADVETAYLLEKVMEDKTQSYVFSSDYANRLMELAASDESARSRIAGKIAGDEPVTYFLRYILYRAGETKRLDEILQPVETGAVAFETVSDLLDYGDFADADKPRIVRVLLANLAGADPLNPSVNAIFGLKNAAAATVDPQTRKSVVRQLAAIAATPGVAGFVPVDCAAALYAIDPASSLYVLAEALSRPNRDPTLETNAGRFLDGGAAPPPPDGTRQDPRHRYADLPAVNAGPKVWKTWQTDTFPQPPAMLTP